MSYKRTNSGVPFYNSNDGGGNNNNNKRYRDSGGDDGGQRRRESAGGHGGRGGPRGSVAYPNRGNRDYGNGPPPPRGGDSHDNRTHSQNRSYNYHPNGSSDPSYHPPANYAGGRGFHHSGRHPGGRGWGSKQRQGGGGRDHQRGGGGGGGGNYYNSNNDNNYQPRRSSSPRDTGNSRQAAYGAARHSGEPEQRPAREWNSNNNNEDEDTNFAHFQTNANNNEQPHISFEEFKALGDKDKLLQSFTKGDGESGKLATLPFEYRDNFPDMRQEAAKKVLAEIETIMAAKKPNDDDDDGWIYDEDGNATRDPSARPKAATAPPAPTKYKWFLDVLPYCLPVLHGFHTVDMYKASDEYCYCPCSNKMKTWRAIVEIDDNFPVCGGKGTTPKGLLDHLTSMINYNDNEGRILHESFGDDETESCDVESSRKLLESRDLHAITLRYLHVLYTDYVAPGMKPEAFYGVGTPKYKEVVSFKSQAMYSKMQKLLSELEEERRKTEEQKKILASMEKINKDRADQLQKIQATQKKLAEALELSAPSAVPKISDKEKQWYLKNMELHKLRWQSDVAKKRKSKAFSSAVNIHVGQRFCLADCVQKWMSKPNSDGAFLFRDLKEAEREIWATQWQIQFQALKTGRKKDNVAAVDEGGPSREFFSEVWGQMGSLAMSFELDNKMKLEATFSEIDLHAKSDNKKQKPPSFMFFGSDREKLSPQEDDAIRLKLNIMVKHAIGNKTGTSVEEHTDVALRHVKQVYRAFGRLIRYCIMHGFTIADHVLPDFYRNYLLRDVMPTDACRYPITDLMRHVTAMMPAQNDEAGDAVKMGEVMDKVLVSFYDGNDDDDAADAATLVEKKRNKFRRVIENFYIKERQIFVDCMREGLMVDVIDKRASDTEMDEFDLPSCLGLFPLEAINDLFFARATVDVGSVINALKPRYDVEFRGGACCPYQQDVLGLVDSTDSTYPVEGALVDILLEADAEGTSLPADLAWFATGYMYIPRTGFEIIVEFNGTDFSGENDDYPLTAHTCENVLKLPGFAYRGNKEILKRQIILSIEAIREKGKFDYW